MDHADVVRLQCARDRIDRDHAEPLDVPLTGVDVTPGR